MTQEPDIAEPAIDPAEQERIDRRGNLFALEVCFLAVVFVIVVLAFIEALSYKIVSSRTPFVIMVPLLVLIVIHARRLSKVREDLGVKARLATALRGGNAHMNKVLGFSLWISALVAIIAAFGHLAGIFLFCIILVRFVASESWKIAIWTAVGTTLFIGLTFEFLFNIELYRGLILRYFLGYRDF